MSPARAVTVAHAALLTTAVVVIVATSRAADWHPVELTVLLAALAIVSDAMEINVRGLRLSASFVALVLAMALLGPAPAAAIGVLTICIDAVRHRTQSALFSCNLATYATFPLLGGLTLRWVGGYDEHGALQFGLLVFAVFAGTNLLNFAMVSVTRKLALGHSVREQLHRGLIPLLPSEAAAAFLAVGVALTYEVVGLPALTALVLVLFLFQVLTRELLLSQDRAEGLEQRTTQLASLQVGVLAALVQTLSLRDKMTARHSAAVARYAKAMAAAAGCSKAEQELVHTAGLLHDIGKFIFPDRILLASSKLTDEDWEIVKRHPAQGAKLVRRLDGYGAVADIILAHHERIDGNGYPNGLAGEEIPLLSRMISIADTYDVMTARDSYRDPVSRAEAIAELRRVSGKQLDGPLVEIFIGLLAERDLSFQHTTDSDFDAELDFERRVQDFAQPPVAA
jgi:putative nucleotidyltransferase with HDIG domain